MLTELPRLRSLRAGSVMLSAQYSVLLACALLWDISSDGNSEHWINHLFNSTDARMNPNFVAAPSLVRTPFS